jgi:hypothetical protein
MMVGTLLHYRSRGSCLSLDPLLEQACTAHLTCEVGISETFDPEGMATCPARPNGTKSPADQPATSWQGWT